MSDTPETDEELAYPTFGFYTMGGLPTAAIKPSFARELERERDALKKHISIMDASHKTANDEYFKLAVENENLERERDAAQKAMGDARDVLLDAMPDANAPTKILAEMIVAERDLWKENSQSNRDEYNRLTEERDKLEMERDLWKLEAERWRDREMP